MLSFLGGQIGFTFAEEISSFLSKDAFSLRNQTKKNTKEVTVYEIPRYERDMARTMKVKIECLKFKKP